MTVGTAQRSISSVEFSEWIAFYILEAEQSGLVQRDPTPDELGDKLTAAFALHNAKQDAVGKVTRVRR